MRNKNYWQALSEIYVAEESDFLDWCKHIYCLCSRVLLKTPKLPNQCLENNELLGFDLDQPNVIEYDDFLYEKNIYISELKSIVTLCFSNNKYQFNKKSSINLLKVKNCIKFNNKISNFQIYFKTSSELLNASALSLLFMIIISRNKNFLLNVISPTNENFIEFQILTNDCANSINKHKISYQNQINLYSNLFDCSFIKSFLHIQYEYFWLHSGQQIVLLFWIIKYVDYLDPKNIENFKNSLKVNNIELNNFLNTYLKLSNCENTKNKDTFIESEQEWQNLWYYHSIEIYNNFYKLFIFFMLKYINIYEKLNSFLKYNVYKKTTINCNLKFLYINFLVNKLNKKFYRKVFRSLKMTEKSSEANIISEEDSSLEIPEINNVKKAFKIMGYSSSFGNNKTLKLKGEVIFKNKNIKNQNKKLKMKGLNLNYSSDLKNEFAFEEIVAINKIKQDLEKDEDKIVSALDIKNNKNKKRKKKKKHLPDEIKKHPELWKYWAKRYRFFSEFDKGIKLDYESWFSVTPEQVAKYTAEKCRCDTIIDAFCGAGGNTIQFAFTCQRVIAIDIDPEKIKMAKHNAKLYGVEDRIEFIIGDFLKLHDKLVGDVVFLSPPWGGPSYTKVDIYDLEYILNPVGGKSLFETAKKITENIAYYLPRNIDVEQLMLLAGPGNAVEVEQNFLDNSLIAITAYYGEIMKEIN